MKKIIVILLAMAAVNTLLAQDGFRGYAWGTSKEYIEEKEGLPPYSHPRGNPKWYLDSLFNREVMVEMSYSESKLYLGTYMFISPLTGDALNFFRNAEKALVDKYGYSDKNSIMLNDPDLLNLMNKDESYTIMFNGNIELKYFHLTLYNPKKPCCVAIIYRAPTEHSYSDEDSQKL